MKPTMLAFAMMALFALTACGGGGGGSTPVAENNPPTQGQPSTPPRMNTDPTSPQPLPPPAPIDWRYDMAGAGLAGSYVAWDGASMSILVQWAGNYFVDMPTNAVLAPNVPDTLRFLPGRAWGAIAGDSAPMDGNAEIVLHVPTRILSFDFDFEGTRLDSGLISRGLTGWQWRDGNGAGSLITTRASDNAPLGTHQPFGVYGVEGYDNSAGVRVEAAYLVVR